MHGNDGHSGSRRPFILLLCHPLTGHLTPAIRVAAALHSLGWPVFFLGPTAHRCRITATGATFLPLCPEVDLDDLQYYSTSNPDPPVPGYFSLPWQERALVDMRSQCLEAIPGQWQSVKDALAELHKRDPTRRVIIICEALFHGLMPMYYGAPLPDETKPPISLCLSVTVPLIRSVDLPPFGCLLAFDPSPSGRQRNEKYWDRWAIKSASLSQLLDAKLAEAGARRSVDSIFMSGANYLCHAGILQLGVPSFYYPRSDWPALLKFVGIVPTLLPPNGKSTLPNWWDEVVQVRTNSKDKKLVVVAQGTVEYDPHDLIIPTIKALSMRPDVLVVAILGRKGATLPAEIELPVNARVADYLAYDAVLPYAHVWVHNAGYGAVTHGIAHGVPMVVAGEGHDKPENARRVQFSGIGVDLGTARPRVEDVRKAVYDVLDNKTYKNRVEVLQKEAEVLDCFRRIEEEILQVIR